MSGAGADIGLEPVQDAANRAIELPCGAKSAIHLAMKSTSLVGITDLFGHRTLQMVRRYAYLSESRVGDSEAELGEEMFRQSP